MDDEQAKLFVLVEAGDEDALLELLHAGVSVELIQRWGRWASSAFQAYLRESADDARGIAAKMIASRGSLTVTRQL